MQRFFSLLLYSGKESLLRILTNSAVVFAIKIPPYGTFTALRDILLCTGRIDEKTAVLFTGLILEPVGGNSRRLRRNPVPTIQPLGGTSGRATEIELAAKHILRMKEHLNRHLAPAAGKCMEEITRGAARDNYMSAEDAASYGLVNAILQLRSPSGWQ